MRTEKEIEKEMYRAADSDADLFGMTYQDGVESALAWVLDDTVEPPMDGC
jgi:hypothetical protein